MIERIANFCHDLEWIPFEWFALGFVIGMVTFAIVWGLTL